MGRINSIGSWFEKITGGWIFGTQLYKLIFKGNVEIQGGVGNYEHTFQNKDGILAHLDDIPGVPSWQDTIDVDKNADRARLYYNVFTPGTFGGLAGASPANLVQDPNTGRIYVYGYFTTYESVSKNYIVAILPNGDIDETFNIGTGLNSWAFASTDLAIQADGKVILPGSFTNYNGTPANRIIRLNTDGSVDGTFVYGSGFNNFTTDAVIDNNGKIYVGGNYGTYNGISGLGRIIRLNPDGTRDVAFASGTGFDNTVTSIKVDASNNVYIAGYFSSFNGTSGHNRLIKLLSNGTIDGSFNTGTGFNNGLNQPSQIFFTSDNKIMIIGYFTLYNGVTVNKALKLNLDGTIDTSFTQEGTGFNGTYITHFVEDGGNYYFSGDFTSYNGQQTLSTVVLSPTGALVRTFPEFAYTYYKLSNGDILASKWNGTNYVLGLLEDNYVINVKEFDYSEVDGKARYKVGGLETIESQEIMPRRLIEELILQSTPALDFIPLSGTEVGSPVTGDIEIDYDDVSDYKIYQKDISNDSREIIFTLSRNIFLKNDKTDSDGVTSELNINGNNVILRVDEISSSKTNFLDIAQDYIVLNDEINEKGLDGASYYGANYTDNTYVQKKYVDDSLKQTRLTNATVSGTFNLDWAAYDVFELTLTGITTFADINLPTGTNTKIIELIVNGNFALTLPPYWEALPSNDTYTGTKRNHFVVSCYNGNPASEKALYQLETLNT